MYINPRLVMLLAWLAVSPVRAQVTVQEYPIPRGHGIHDVWPDPARNGPVYFSAQGSGHLGILDPKSGKVEFVSLGRGSSPHGVILDRTGAPFLTDGGQNAIVRVDPQTRAVKVWKLPEDSGYTNLNTAIFDGNGIHWFTGQSGIYGRLDPASGETKLFDAPKGRGPYGINTTPDRARGASGRIPRATSGLPNGTPGISAASSRRRRNGRRGRRPATSRTCTRCTSIRTTRCGRRNGPRRPCQPPGERAADPRQERRGLDAGVRRGQAGGDRYR